MLLENPEVQNTAKAQNGGAIVNLLESSQHMIDIKWVWLTSVHDFFNGPVELVDLPMKNGDTYRSKLLVYKRG